MSGKPLKIEDRRDLAAFVADLDDEQVLATVHEYGLTQMIERMFDGMAEEYLPNEGPREPAAVQWDIVDTDGSCHTWQFVASREGIVVGPGEIQEPAVVLRLDVLSFIGLMAGTVRGLNLLASGALKLKGSLQLAMEMEAWFAR